MRLNTPVRRQETLSSCAVACLRMVLEHYGTEVDEGISVARATDDDRVVSVMVVNLSRRFKGLELVDIPLALSGAVE